jgi:membrane fusion protein, heavy metal efflux system
MRLGMFVTATFTGRSLQTRTAIPSTAILHLRDRDWVFAPAGNNRFRRVAVTAGATLPNNMQEIDAGIDPGMRVVQNALELENTVEQ